MDLFESIRNKNKTLSDFLRPKTIAEVVGQKHLIGVKMPFRTLLETDRLNSVIMFGPPGTGKTTISRIYAGMTGSPFIQLNAALCGTADIKNAATAYLDKKPVVFIDEIHRFNKAQQDVLLPYIEDGKIKFIGATTHNPLIYIVPALRSRSMIFELKHITVDDMLDYIKSLFESGKILEFVNKELGVNAAAVIADEKLIDYLSKSANGDVRVLLNVVETTLITKFSVKEEYENKEAVLNIEDAKAVIPEKIAFYDRDQDEHYNVISAFIKSIRGSDIQAAVYYLARMIHCKEDPRFIARRLIILASEDVGMADPRALQIACDALAAVEHVGMPEARIVLSQAVIYLAGAPKSNSAYLAINAAMQYCENNPDVIIPDYLKNVRIDDKRQPGYKYPHDYPNHYVKQRYMHCDEVFYKPANIGYEAKVNNYLKEITVDRPSR